MKIRNTRTRVRIACFFLVLMTVQGLMPAVAWALTSGPAQPETKQFAQAGTSDMVDLSTGDFKYNIPLLDVDGYPVNLNYQSGIGMDDEASWVGLGWNLNAGAMNRQIRGIADDSDGDEVITENDMKTKTTIGANVRLRGEIFGNGLSGSVSVGIFSDNYTGIGANVGVNIGQSLTNANSSPLNIGLGINSNTADGATASLSLSAATKSHLNAKESGAGGLSLSASYNSREGMKDLTLSTSFSDDRLESHMMLESSYSFNTPTFYPASAMTFKSLNGTFSADFGPAAFGLYAGYGVNGYMTKRAVSNHVQKSKAYGFLYAHKQKGLDNVLTDFIREKDAPVIPDQLLLPLPVVTPDIFTYSSQLGAGQFKAVRHSTGAFFDNRTADYSDNASLSYEYGAGATFHTGISVFLQDITTTNGRWKESNEFLTKGDFGNTQTLEEELAYFKQAGEKGMENKDFVTRIQGEDAVRVPLDKKKALPLLKADGKPAAGIGAALFYKKDGRQMRRSPISYLTAEQAVHAALDKKILVYNPNKFGAFNPEPCNSKPVRQESRDSSYRKKKHISEMTVTGEDGKRMVYGIPVYNKSQTEYTFSTNVLDADVNTGLVPIKRNGTNIDYKPKVGTQEITEQYFHREVQPSYATSYLLTGVLSPDYVDVGNDGITDDDMGTAMKFNYSRVDNYKWRTPGRAGMATHNPGLNADPEDDKASFIFGEKELWYLHSIESKTKIAYFITDVRSDGLGLDSMGNKNSATKQCLLKEIRLYSKSDLSKPIKVVHLDYDYDLCKNVPNQENPGDGKLTLKSVHFTYGSSTKGSNHKYKFYYKEDVPAENPDYAELSSDRWGSYKAKTDNAVDGKGTLRNDQYPYTLQKEGRADVNARKWHLASVELPTGGKITVDYESDDYAYVQDKRATVMQGITGMYDANGSQTLNLRDARSFEMKFPKDENAPLNKSDFMQRYLDANGFMYVKMFVCMSDIVDATLDAAYDFVPVYAKVTDAEVETVGNEVRVRIRFVDDVEDDNVAANAIINAAWQRMRLDYPRYAYPGYKNRISSDRPIAAAVSALGNSIKNMTELLENFNVRAARKNFACKVKLEKSFARIIKADGRKKGGGVRVKRVHMSDEWNAMSGAATAAYGQEYDYTIDNNGKQISSGVAAYEPSLGGDENPMRQPLRYEQKKAVGLNNYFYHEEPAGESFFPAPSVIYREVKVRNLNENGIADPANKTGWLQYEFYTAKEFPVIIDGTDLEKHRHRPLSWLSYFGGRSVSELTMSQGYAIILNDMHGKPKAERVFNQSAQEISSTEYMYAASEEGGRMRLNNKVDVVDATGTITRDQIIGREIELFEDMRESETRNIGLTLNPGIDVFQIGLLTIPVVHLPVTPNEDYRLFRSSCLVKTVQYSGVVKSVIRKVNGAAVTASNVLFDKYTGEPVLVQSENEFKDPVYTLNIPAFWIYEKMGMAYKNLGVILEKFDVDDNAVPFSQFRSYLTAGDELINISDGSRAWVVYTALNGESTKSLRLIDASGRLARSQNGTVRVCRSGYRNLLGSAATSITSLVDPVENNKLKLISNADLSAYKVINATAVLYDEAWGQAPDCNYKSCPEGYEERADGRCYLSALTNPAYTYNVYLAGPSGDYGKSGAFFYNGNNPAKTGESGAAIWHDKLNSVGIWLDGLPANRWWGAEKLLTLETAKDVYIGHSGTKQMRIVIDDEEFFKFPIEGHVGNYEVWNMRAYHFEPGKHSIRVEAVSNGDGATVGMEIYTADRNTLMAGTPGVINASRIYSTDFLRDDPNVYFYELDNNDNQVKGNYICPDGGDVSIMNGYPDCGSIVKGACPEGYVKGPDGQCVSPVNGNANPGLRLVRTDAVDVYSSNGAAFHDMAGTEVARVSDSYWGMPNCTGNSSRMAGLTTKTVQTDTGMTTRYIQDTSMLRSLSLSSAIACGRLNATGIWLADTNKNKWIGISGCLKIPEQKVYYFGFGADNDVRVYIDGVLLKELLSSNGNDRAPFLNWWVYPKLLTKGDHIVTIEARDFGVSLAVGLEVYNNTLEELTSNTANVIYSTIDLLNGNPVNTYVKNSFGQTEQQRFSCPKGEADVCAGSACTLGTSVNPYITGMLGNWLPYKQLAWLSSRSGQELLTNTTGGVNIRQNGYYRNFRAFWIYNNGWSMSGENDWVTSMTSTLYDRYSHELENTDALGRYSAARYGFRSTVPVAVGANMRQREIFYDGFDDYKFNSACSIQPCEPDEFNIQKLVGANYAAKLSADEAHSGNYSLKLTEPLYLKTYLFNFEHVPGIYLNVGKLGEYYRNTQGWTGLRGFCPVSGRKYIFSAWVKDNAPLSTSVKIRLLVNGSDVILKQKAVVEGWKLVEGELNFTPAGETPPVTEVPCRLSAVSGASGILVDDIRIFPYEGQLKTYTYDDQTLRVMAEMDENNYATFYEYDDEGSLVRVKKETERGIMTIKESRSAYSRNP